MTGSAWVEGWPQFLQLVLALILWVGHACIWTTTLNHLYGRAIPKWFLRLYRLACGLLIVGFPAIVWAFLACPWPFLLGSYLIVCAVFGGLIFPALTLQRLLRPIPPSVRRQETRTIDYWKTLGSRAVGDGRLAWMTRLPGTCAFQVDFTTLTLELSQLPTRWEGLRLLVLSDLHFHGTPSREFLEAVFAELRQRPTPDLILFVGDLLDTDEHSTWIQPLLGSLSATEGRYAILGNHDLKHHPELIREELRQAGYTVLGNDWTQTNIRGEPAVIVGHEGPWFAGVAELRDAPNDAFRLLLSHTPDNFAWAQSQGVQVMVSGHVHGGQIRLPIIGPIFIPSIYGRRYDEGVFEANGTIMVVNRGLSGKETLRFRCRAQVTELILVGRQPG